MKKVGEMIRRARVTQGLTQGELGERIGTSAVTICELEKGQRRSVPSPAEMVSISDALLDRSLLQEYCDVCPLRKRIMVRKFPPLNNILHGPQVSTMKVMQKMSEASDLLQNMLPKMLRKGFEADPDYREFRNTAVIKIIDVKRGTEILLDQLQVAGVISADDLHMLMEMQQILCEQKGHHVPDSAVGER
jgi:transcriptional regulator with XRE-family HTH domain